MYGGVQLQFEVVIFLDHIQRFERDQGPHPCGSYKELYIHAQRNMMTWRIFFSPITLP